MRDVEKRIAKLEQRFVVRAERGRVVVLEKNEGEDVELVAEAWKRDNPAVRDPVFRAVINIAGVLPRLELASERSVREALPLVKRWLPYKAGDVQAEEAQWRELARLAGIDYDRVEALP